ncbi:MAG: phasin family protein [Chitinivibrionales bacterium]|nr:phasin family protein [Chitinivibrionales bacterium]
MLELIKKSFFTSVGMVYLTKEKIEELAKRIVHEANMSEAEGRTFVAEMIQKSEDAKAGLENAVKQHVEKIFKKLDIPTRSEVTQLREKIATLEEQIKK